MTSMNKEAMVLKSDGVGRVQTPVDRQVDLVREFERSGLSGPRFAAMAGIKYQTFATWRRKHGVRAVARQQQPARSVTLLEAVVSACQSEPAGARGAGELLIELPAGAQMRLQSAAQIPLAAQLIQALQQTLPC